MKKSSLILYPILFGIFVFLSSVSISHFFFSQLSIIETIQLPEVILGPIFLTIVAFIIVLVIDSIKENTCFNVLNFPALQINYDGKIVFINNYFKKTFDYNFIGKNILEMKDLIIESTRYYKTFNAILKNPKAYEKFSESFSTTKGNHFSISVVRVTNKRITIIAINETKQKQLEQKFEETQNMYKNLIDSLPLPIGCRNSLNEIEFSNTKLDHLMKSYPDVFKDKKFDKYLKYTIENEKEVKFNIKIGEKIYEVNQALYKKESDNYVIRYGIDKTKDYFYQQQMKKRLEYQNALYKIQRLFLSIDSENFDEQINKVLKNVLEYLEVENAYFYELKNNKRFNFHEYKRTYVPSFTNKIEKISPDSDSEFLLKLNENGDFIINNSHENKTNAHKVFSSIGAISVLETCLYGKNFMGMFGVSTFTKQKSWKRHDILFIKIIGETILNTLERMQVELSLKESEETFEILTENSPMGVIIFDVGVTSRRDNIHFINKEALNILGYTKEELNKLKIEDIIDDDYQDAFQKLLDERKKENNRDIIKFLKKDGSSFVDLGLKEIKISEDKFSKHILCTMIERKHISNKDG